MKYLSQAAWAWLVDWIAPKWAALRGALTWTNLKAKASAALKRVRARNTGDR